LPKDVKTSGLMFNPAKVKDYRLIGYRKQDVEKWKTSTTDKKDVEN